MCFLLHIKITSCCGINYGFKLYMLKCSFFLVFQKRVMKFLLKIHEAVDQKNSNITNTQDFSFEQLDELTEFDEVETKLEDKMFFDSVVSEFMD